MTTRAPSPGQLEQSFARANQLQADLQRKERAIGRKVQREALSPTVTSALSTRTSARRRTDGGSTEGSSAF